MNVEELTQSLQLHSIRNHDWHIQVGMRRKREGAGASGVPREGMPWVRVAGLPSVRRACIGTAWL